MKFHRKTRKIFYENQLKFSCQTEFIKSIDGCLEFKDTVAYPEGGGQDSDIGFIVKDNIHIRFIKAKKMYAHSPRLKEFPSIQVDGIVLHQVHPEDIDKIKYLREGDFVHMEIDSIRRFDNSLSHTASHIVYAAIGDIRPDVIPETIGCHIKTGSARFDFSTGLRFTLEEIASIQERASSVSLENITIFIKAHKDVPDARIWCCGDYEIPCGGTHLSSTKPIGNLVVRRKSLGASKERLSCEFPNAMSYEDALSFLGIEIKS
mgnify:CR=1 FL=1